MNRRGFLRFFAAAPVGIPAVAMAGGLAGVSSQISLLDSIKRQGVPKFATGGSFKVGRTGAGDVAVVFRSDHVRLAKIEREGWVTMRVRPGEKITFEGGHIKRDQIRELFDQINNQTHVGG